MKYGLTFLVFLFVHMAVANKIFVPMDGKQANHLKAYGVAYWVLEKDVTMEWLLNYRGGSFMFPYLKGIEERLVIKGVSYEIIPDGRARSIIAEISDPEANMEVVQLEVAPKIAVYTPPGKLPWDDAVTLVLTYAEIPYAEVYDAEVVNGMLAEYDWLHLHHEDFTGQYGKFYASFRSYPWYKQQVADLEALAASLGFNKVSQMKLAVATTIKNFVIGGGFLFTMCSGTDSFDIALAALNTDICESMYDGDPMHHDCQERLDFNQTLAFQNFQLVKDPMKYEYSNIDGTDDHMKLNEKTDKFELFDFSAKWDIVPTILTQCHTSIINGFMGQTTDFRKQFIKSNVIVMAENKALGTARYIHGELGMGTWTFYGGHDPEDYRHVVGDPPTDLNLYPNSPGYRLILNNILFPAAKKQKQKT
jgi:hypothetical protein